MRLGKFMLGVIMVIGMLSSVFAFEDTVGYQYEKDIAHLAEMGVVQGYEGNIYKPDQVISRAELLKIILKTANVDIESGLGACFHDVFTGDWYHDVVCTAKKLKIIGGYEDGSFKPNQQVLLVEGLKMAIEGFWFNVNESNNWLWYEKYQDFVDEQWIFSKYRYFPEQVMTRGMMAHLANELLKWLGGQRGEISGFKSFWCGKAQPTEAPSEVVVGGRVRHFLTQVGRNYRSDRPAKLIFGFHGRTSDHYSVAGYYHLKDSEDNAIFVYPLGLPEEWPARNWREWGDKMNRLRDYELFDAIREKVEQNYCIDTNQIYVAGHSLWGWFTSMLNCARGAEIRGVGVVAWSSLPFPKCSGPSAAIIFHNPADRLASFAGGEQIRNQILKQNQCSSETREYQNSYGMECVEYLKCIAGAPVVFCKYFEGDHMRPAGATQMMVDFWSRAK